MSAIPAETEITDADFRRAAAAMAHFTTNDAAGVRMILDEAEEAGRLRALFWCIAAMYSRTWRDDPHSRRLAASAWRSSVAYFAAQEAEADGE